MSLLCTIKRVLQTESTGVSFIQRDKHTIIVHNCQAFCYEQLESITKLHPETSVVVQANDSSSSGYIVIFTDSVHRQVIRTADFFTVLTCSVLLTCGMSILT